MEGILDLGGRAWRLVCGGVGCRTMGAMPASACPETEPTTAAVASVPPPAHSGSGRGVWRTLTLGAAAALGMMLASLDFSVNVALPALRDAFGVDLAAVQWVIVVFIATRAGLALGAGAFADRFGLRAVYLFGTVVYLGSMACLAWSPTLEAMVGFRVVQAVGTGCLYSTAPAIAARVFPERRRGLSMGFTSASLALGMVASTLAAGALVQSYGWPAVYWGRIPLAALALAAGWLSVPGRRGAAPDANTDMGKDTDALASSTAAARRFDLPGATLTLALLLCLMIGLRLGQAVGWTAPVVIGLLAAAPIVLSALVLVERRAANPVLPGALARLGGFRTATIAMFLGHFAQFVIWFIFPFYITDALGRGSLTLGIMLATISTTNIISSPIGGWLCDRWSVRPVGALGLSVVAAGLLAMSLLDGASAIWHPAVAIGVVGLGVGWFQSAAYALMLGSVPAARYGTASGAMSLAQASGTVLCVAVVGAVFAALNDYYAGGGATAAEAFLLAYRDAFRIGAATAATAALWFGLKARRS